MKAIQVSSFGAPEVLRLAELPDPAPGPGEVAIDVTHAAVGLIDVFIRQGLYRDRPGLPQPPYVPGLEVAGTVRALGEGVCRVRGRRARGDLTGQQRHGGYAAIFVSDAAYVASMKDVSLPGHKDLARPAAAAAIIAAAASLAQAHVETLPLASATVVHERLENHSVNGRLVLHP